MTILQINSNDIKGGAASVSWRLHNKLNCKNNYSYIAVKQKFSNDNKVIIIDNDKYRNLWFQVFNNISDLFVKQSWTMSRLFKKIANPKFYIYKELGREYFDFDGLISIIKTVKPDIIHAHILHGDFVDLNYISKISKKIPIVITLHDAWLLSGHCAHSFDCNKWTSGCGSCPDLTIRPAVKRDSTSFNWNKKKQIYSNASFVIITPCYWLMNMVNKSILHQAIIENKVIPNGVNLDLFKPENKKEIREKIGINNNKKVLLFASNGIKNNIWKDFKTLKEAIKIISENTNIEILLIAVGEKLDSIKFENCTIEFKSFVSEIEMVLYYQAADIYVHPANADTFPTTILEALASGLPVIATNICGIPEQVKGLKNNFIKSDHFNTFEKNEATGILVNKNNPEEIAKAITELLFDDELRNILSQNARRDAKGRFDLDVQIENYLKIYKKITKKE